MARFLQQLGRFSFRRRGLVTGIWVALLIAFGLGALGLSGQLSNAVTIPGTESQQAIDHLKESFPESGVGGATARVVVEAPEGQSFADPNNTAGQAEIAKLVAALEKAPKVDRVTNPLAPPYTISPEDGRTALIQVGYAVQGFELTDGDREALRAAAEPAEAAGMTVEIGGDAMQGSPETGAVEVMGVAVAAIVLIITFGSIVAAGLPLLTALLGVGVGMAGILITSGLTELNANTPILALMIGLAVGIDYALFIMSRYRTELAAGRDHEDAAGRAVGTAGSAVIFAGLTVIIALAGLSVVGIPFLAEMGIAAAVTVAVAVLIALTLLPAVLGFAGDRVRAGRIPGLSGGSGPNPMGRRWAGFVSRHRIAVLLTAIAGLAVVALPAASMQLGLPNDSTTAPDSSRHKAYDMVSEGFGAGVNGPLVIVIDTSDSADPKAAIERTVAEMSAVDNVATPTQPQSKGATTVVNLIPKTGPSDAATETLVHDLRDVAARLHDQTGATISVTGQTAANIDVSEKLADAMVPYLALIVGLAFLLLMLVFRSVIVPLKATLGFLASVVATFGAVVAVFQWGWLGDLLGVAATGPIMSMLPILLIGVLFGLAMDYQVFLVTRMREEYVHGAPAGEAMVTGFRHGSRVVVAAALIMTSVFGGFVFAGDTLIQSIGFALAFGVAIDAFVVRMTIVPALMALLGRAAWWLPRWLDRILPNVDVEGAKLTATDPPEERPARVPEPV